MLSTPDQITSNQKGDCMRHDTAYAHDKNVTNNSVKINNLMANGAKFAS